MTSRLPSLSLAALILCAGLSAAAPNPPQPLYCDMAEYSPRQLTWSRSAGPGQVGNVFPHPLLPSRVLAASDNGLWLSDDAGQTWAALPQASAEKVGAIRGIAFDPEEAGTFYAASATTGVWVTRDAGKSFQQIGSAASGMAADATADIIVYSGDTTHQTLLAVHGNDAGGISRTRDGGRTWDVLNQDYCFRRILGREKNSSELFLWGSTKGEPDIQTLYFCSSPTEPPVELMRDAMVTDMAFSPVRDPSPLYVATSDSGLRRINPSRDASIPLGKKDESWSSVAASWGPNADVVGLCLYDPSKRGLVFSTDDLAASQTIRGPLVSTLVKEGAAVRPNANGTVFYAVANGTLTVGRSGEKVPSVSVTPAAFEPSREDAQLMESISAAFQDFSRTPGNAAKAAVELQRHFGDLASPYRRAQITIAARLPVAPAPPVSVTVDLSRFGGSATAPLYDDGQHGDGAEGDGVYGLTFCFRPLAHPPRPDDWRRSWPGRVALGVTATYADGQRQGAVGLAAIYPKIESYDLWAKIFDKAVFYTKGDVAADVIPGPPGVPNGGTNLCVKTGKGPWSVFLRFPWGRNDITGYQALTFRIRAGEGPVPEEIYVQLRDSPELTAPVISDRLPLIAQGVREAGIGADFRRAVLPFSSLLSGNSKLETGRLDTMILSGDGGPPATFCIDCPRVLATMEEAAPANGTPSK